MDKRVRKESIESIYSFIKASLEFYDGNGSSAYYSLFRYPLEKWAPPYPETSGYLIQTLLSIHRIYPDWGAYSLAYKCGKWLTQKVQHANGSFPQLYAGNEKPSFFNTAQILIGLQALEDVSPEKEWSESIEKALDWIQSILEKGIKKVDVHYKGSIPTYYTRAYWPICHSAKLVRRKKTVDLLKAEYEKLLDRFDEDYFPVGAGFDGSNSFLHTLAYTGRGILEMERILPSPKGRAILSGYMNTLCRLYKEGSKGWAGSYDKGWKGDFSYRCLPGEYQMSILFSKARKDLGVEDYSRIAQKTLEKSLAVRSLFFPKGAILGSKPIWGKYMPFKAPNWGGKFALDALLILENEN